jgi:hypothetical protein
MGSEDREAVGYDHGAPRARSCPAAARGRLPEGPPSTGCGVRPGGEDPPVSAMVRHDRWVCSLGLECRANWTISATCSPLIEGLRPRHRQT